MQEWNASKKFQKQSSAAILIRDMEEVGNDTNQEAKQIIERSQQLQADQLTTSHWKSGKKAHTNETERRNRTERDSTRTTVWIQKSTLHNPTISEDNRIYQ